MVIDEAQRMKEPTAQCTRHGFDIAAQVPNRYLLTGTPVLNRETELHTLLRLSGHPIGQLPLKEFCDRFAGNPEFRQSLRAELNRMVDELFAKNQRLQAELAAANTPQVAEA